MNQISRIAPVTDIEAARMVSPGTLADLASQITATPLEPGRSRHGVLTPALARSSPRSAARRRLLLGAPLAVLAAVAILILTLLGPVGTGPAAAQALSFTTHDGYITVIVRDPVADPSRYRSEFAQHHLDITLQLFPASPSLIGTVDAIEQSGGSDLIPITAKGRCYIGRDDACPVGVKIPVTFHGQATLYFGRSTRPGEQYKFVNSAFAAGEVMHGMRAGQTVAQVLAALQQRHVTVAVFIKKNNTHLHPSQVPGTWYVTHAYPWASQQVMLQVGPSPAS
jgi:hypothetical protein